MGRNETSGHRGEHKLTLEAFRDLVDLYGGDKCRWPEGIAERAEALTRESSAAREILANACELDAALLQTPAPAPASDSLKDAIIANATLLPQSESVGEPFAEPVLQHQRTRKSFLDRLLDSMDALSDQLRPSVLVPQGAACATLFAVGLMVGMGEPVTAEEQDVSDWLFPDYEEELSLASAEFEEIEE